MLGDTFAIGSDAIQGTQAKNSANIVIAAATWTKLQNMRDKFIGDV
jgi:hypothetical protein